MEFPLLSKSILWEALSEKGRSIFQPEGIFYWNGRAKKEAEIIGTIGAIVGPEYELLGGQSDKKVTFYIPALKNFVGENPADIVPYAPIAGIPEMRTNWQDWIILKGKNAKNLPSGTKDLTDKITLPVIVPGITYGIFLSANLFLNPGELIVSPNKRWGNYDSVLSRQSGAVMISFEMFTQGKDAEFNVAGMIEKLEDSIKTQNKAVVILNFPNNPTGYVPVKETVEKIVKGLDELGTKHKKPIVVLCDDAYEGYVYHEDGITASLFYELVGLNEYIIPLKLDGSSKEMLMYGGRIAAVTLGLHEKWYLPENSDEFVKEIENKFKAVIRSTVSNSNRFIQSTLIKMFEGGIEKIIEDRKKIIDIVGERYTLINKLLSEIKSDAITVDPNQGGFFLLINVDKKVKATDFNEHLLKKYKTGLIPIVKEDQNINCLRIAYSSVPKSQIPQLVENIKNTLIDFDL